MTPEGDIETMGSTLKLTNRSGQDKHAVVLISPQDKTPPDKITPDNIPPDDISSKTCVSKKILLNSSVLNYPKTCVSKNIKKLKSISVF